jgi:hypothetical protein
MASRLFGRAASFSPGVPGFSVRTWTLKYDTSLGLPYFLLAVTFSSEEVTLFPICRIAPAFLSRHPQIFKEPFEFAKLNI